jgi:D-sedoheptulose 7-phosphate isomerase
MSFDQRQDYEEYVSHLQSLLAKLIDKKYFEQLSGAFSIIKEATDNNNLIISCGNGGSASDSSHFTAELVCRFEKDRRPLKSVSLATDLSVISAISNDLSYENIFERQLNAISGRNDVLIIFSTSGSSKNCLEAAKIARRKGLKTILFTGSLDATIHQYADLVVEAPSPRTCHIQEIHRVQYHLLCSWIENTIDRVE